MTGIVRRSAALWLVPAIVAGAAAARAEPILVPTYVPAAPRGDAGDLATLAPPSNAATARQTYGDAIFGRRVPRVTQRAFRGTQPHFRGYVCLDGPNDRPGHPCPPANEPRVSTYYAFTPSHVSAPQVYAATPGAPSPLLSPVTRFFLDPFR